MDIKNKLTSDQRGGRMGIMRDRREKVKSRNMYKGHMDKDNGMGIIFGSGGWMGRARRGMGTTITEQK